MTANNRKRPSDLQDLLDLLHSKSLNEQPEQLLALRRRIWDLAQYQLPTTDPLRREIDSEDLAQLTLLQLVRNGNSFRGTTWEEFFAFVSTIVAQQKVDLARHYTRDKRIRDDHTLTEHTLERTPPTPSTILTREEDRERLRALILELPPSLRAALEHRLAGRDYAEIAEREQATVESVRQRISRALRVLRERWRKG